MQQLDVISVFRRLRMHGFALSQHLGKWIRIKVSEMARRKSIDMILTADFSGKVSGWAVFEHLSLSEKMELAIYKRYNRIYAEMLDEKLEQAQGPTTESGLKKLIDVHHVDRRATQIYKHAQTAR